MNKERIEQAIENKETLKISINHGSISTVCKVTPLKIVDDSIVIGVIQNTNKKLHFGLTDILTEAINIKSDVLDKMDVSKLAKASEKMNINITEAEEGEFSVSSDLPKEEKKVEVFNIDQKESETNISAWADQLGESISGFEKVGDKIISAKIIVKNIPRLILIYPNGNIKISGHRIKTFDDFKNILTFFYQN